MDVLKWLAHFLPVDPDPTGGFWIFRLPERCKWMGSVFEAHDRYYIEGPLLDPPMRLADIDWRVFKALTMAAESEPDLIKRCHRAKDICKYWRIMRACGHALYNRHRAAP